ncbi:melanoma-associated antigen 8-like [Ochotona curzoniae]|uniref:melanoma-associated antigen 8-like n=1 Tax=Ochotona curzoniae TaxID=130825 RepID=UPI001B34D21C|nr:melanoma-associated antigen 8-like [Ochotona curzoniae]
MAGKYGTSYGASLWKMVKKIEISQHAKYTCSFCGKTKMKRHAVGIWHCGSCIKTVAGGRGPGSLSGDSGSRPWVAGVSPESTGGRNAGVPANRPEGSHPQLLPTLVPAVPKKVIMMPFGQKSVPAKVEGDHQAQEEAAGFLVLGEGEALAAGSSSSSAPVAAAHEKEVAAGSGSPPGSPPGSPHRASSPATSSPALTQSEESSSSQDEAGPSPWQCLQDPESLFQGALEEKMADLVRLLLLKYRLKEPITKAEMLSHVTKEYEAYFPFMFRKVSECIQVALGIHVKQVDPVRQCYVLETALGLTYNGMQDHDRSMPKTSFLIMVLGLIFSNGNRVSEEELWEALSVLEIYDGREHYIYGEPRRLLTEEWVRERYIEYRQVPCSEPARYEFLWGPRTRAETTKMRVLQYLARYYSVEPESYASLYLEALREENQRAQLGDAA